MLPAMLMQSPSRHPPEICRPDRPACRAGRPRVPARCCTMRFDLQTDLAAQTRAWGRMLNDAWTPWIRWSEPARWMSANARMMMRAGLTFARPAYGIEAVDVGNRSVPVRERPSRSRRSAPCSTSRRTSTPSSPSADGRAAVGPFATLLRATVRTMLPDHDVYITDWHNARDIPVSAGRFGFDEYVAHLVQFLQTGRGLARVRRLPAGRVQALVAARRHGTAKDAAAAPRSMTLMADRGLPDQPDRRERARDLEADRMVREEPDRHGPGAPQGCRPPGLSGLRAGLGVHVDEQRSATSSHTDLFWHMANGEDSKAEAIETFYDEYFAVLDLAPSSLPGDQSRRFPDYITPSPRTSSAKPRRADRPRSDPAHGADDRRGRARRHLRPRPDHGRPRPLHRARAVYAVAPPPGRRRPLRRLRRKRWETQIYPQGAQLHPGA